jgi:aminopeptidase-like protein
MTVLQARTEQAAISSGKEPGDRMHELVADLYPYCRSITGDGVRQTLARIQEDIPIKIHEVPSGTRVLDWTVPKEWNIRDAYVRDRGGNKVIDFGKSNLHVVSYSAPIRDTLPLAALKSHLFADPQHPDWIPYRTSYYKETWGFCLRHNDLLKLEDGDYEVCIDASLKSGHLTYGELYLPGEISDEFLISCHVCHPSLCNDNLSGIAVATFLAKQLQDRSRRHSFRFLFIPATIGAVT